MRCAWDQFVNILPLWMRNRVDEIGRNSLQELRLRINSPPELVFQDKSVFLKRCVIKEDIQFCVNLATQYSPWASETVSSGFISIPGGHRIGLCGATIPGREGKGFRSITSICIRISRDYIGIAKGADVEGSLLIIGAPGAGKTTFLRDIIRQLSEKDRTRIAVVDERFEIFPCIEDVFCYNIGPRVDILSGCNKSAGIEMVLRTMTPTVIAVDEITSSADAEAVLHCVGCGVSLIATAHAAHLEELSARPVYKKLIKQSVFQTVVILNTNRTWKMERIVA